MQKVVGYPNQDTILFSRDIPSSKSQTKCLGYFPAQISPAIFCTSYPELPYSESPMYTKVAL